MKRATMVTLMVLLAWAPAKLAFADEVARISPEPEWLDGPPSQASLASGSAATALLWQVQPVEIPLRSALAGTSGIPSYTGRPMVGSAAAEQLGSPDRIDRWFSDVDLPARRSGLDLIVRGQALRPLEGDRPEFTQSSATVGFSRAQVEGGYTFVHAIAGDLDRQDHVLPELLVRVGVLEQIEVRFGWHGYTFRRWENTRTGSVTNEQGTSDVDIGAKLGLTEQNGWIPRTALITEVSVPLRDAPFGSTVVGGRLNFIYTWMLAEYISVGGSTGGTWAEEAGDHYSQFHESVVVNLGLTEELGFFFETFALFRPDHAESRPHYYVDGGFTYKLTPDIQIDWRAGWGLSDVADEFFNGVGVVWRR